MQKLLGKPKRTALKTAAWTYAWSSQQSLNIVFGAKTAGEWQVNSWEWPGY